MPDFAVLESVYSQEMQENKVHYLADSQNKGIICKKCGLPVDNYDPGSNAYQEYYGHPLPAICDCCLNDIFGKVGRYGRGV